MRHTKIGLILAVSSLLSACGDSPEPTNTAADTQAKPVETQVKKYELGERRSLISEFPLQDLADPQQYRDTMQPLVLVDLYHSLRTNEENADDIAQSLTREHLGYEGFPSDFLDLLSRYGSSTDAFDKRDAAKAVVEAIKARKIDEGDRRVRVDFTSSEINLGPYDFERKGFPVDTMMFLPEQSEVPSSWDITGQYKYIKPHARSYVAIPPVNYKLGFENAGDLALLKVEDESAARLIEGNRGNVKISIYGSVVRAFRDYDFSGEKVTPKDTRYVVMQPQRVDLVDQKGNVLFTINL